MDLPPLFSLGPLASLPLLSRARTRSISAENPRGEKGGGARELPLPGSPAAALGKGWKARPCIPRVEPGARVVLADIAGSGVVQHIWITCDPRFYRSAVLRMWWDGEQEPSVEVPLGDFFANGHGRRYSVQSLMVCSNPSGGFNSYWPMPFGAHARIELENGAAEPLENFYYQITYALTELPPGYASFHAQWRRTSCSRAHPEHVLLDGVRGAGHYVGTHLAWTQKSDGWWGEGEVKFFLDGDAEDPTICGTGTEDYFGGAWGFGSTYQGPFLGYPLWAKGEGEVPKHALYRWHVLDPIRFERDLRVTVQALGWRPEPRFEPLDDDIASVALWYQREPHAAFPLLPDRATRCRV
jgi:hypothetical protein